MAFMMQSMDVGQTPPLEYRQAAAEETVVLGEALVTNAAGLLTKCGATAKPEYVAAGPQDEQDILIEHGFHTNQEDTANLKDSVWRAAVAAAQAQGIADRTIVVLSTRTIPQGLTAMLNFDPDASEYENATNMMQAADKVATGLVTFAARDSDFDGRKIKKGEILALENGKLVATGTDVTKVTYRLARSMCKKDTNFITVISGCDVSEEDAARTTELVQAKCPAGIEVTHLNGGQPVYYYIISVE